MRSKVFNPIYPVTPSCDNWRKGLVSAAKEDIFAIEEALIAGGNNNYTVKELQGLNHHSRPNRIS